MRGGVTIEAFVIPPPPPPAPPPELAVVVVLELVLCSPSLSSSPAPVASGLQLGKNWAKSQSFSIYVQYTDIPPSRVPHSTILTDSFLPSPLDSNCGTRREGRLEHFFSLSLVVECGTRLFLTQLNHPFH